MKILITELGDFRIMDDVARKWGIATPVITQPVKEPVSYTHLRAHET